MNVARELRSRSAGHGRLIELDALRGVAALIVVWHHFRLAFDVSDPRWYLRPFFAGEAAVMVFFTLSGFVLSMPVWTGRQPGYGAYLVRRFFRIYVPYAAAVLLAVLGAHFFLNAQKPLSEWFYHTWHEPVTAKLVAEQLLFALPQAKVAMLNTAFWSLRYEAIMSLVMPVLALGVRRAGVWATLGACVAMVIVARQFPLGAVRLTLLYASCFALGAVLSLRRKEMAAWYAQAGWAWKAALAVATVAMFCSVRVGPTIVGSAGVIVLAMNSQAKRWLETAVPEYLGKISYSMYLVHGTVLWALLSVLAGRVAIWELALAYAVTVLAASHLFCVLIEEPALRLGKRLTMRPGKLVAASASEAQMGVRLE
ncbi:MAG: acyltransferase [Acidobacteriota bacterium]